jgi:hypothetical protein
MRRWIAPAIASLLAACADSNRDAGPTATRQEVLEGAREQSNFELVGRNPLFNRGMNAALAIFDHFVYIGNRSDGSSSCGDLAGSGSIVPVLTPTAPGGTCPHVHPGILIVDVENPENPTVVGEIPASVAAPNAAGQPIGVTSRELRVCGPRRSCSSS